MLLWSDKENVTSTKNCFKTPWIRDIVIFNKIILQLSNKVVKASAWIPEDPTKIRYNPTTVR